MGGTPPEKKKQVMPSETSHPISFVMKRLVELTMTNGRRLVRLFFYKELAEDPGPPRFWYHTQNKQEDSCSFCFVNYYCIQSRETLANAGRRET
jgi:hypothetical protein